MSLIHLKYRKLFKILRISNKINKILLCKIKCLDINYDSNKFFNINKINFTFKYFRKITGEIHSTNKNYSNSKLFTWNNIINSKKYK